MGKNLPQPEVGEAGGAGGGAKHIPLALHNAAWVLQRTRRGSGPRPLGKLPCLVALPGGGSPDFHTLFLILKDEASMTYSLQK